MRIDPIFIIGLPRSGTTFLMRLVNASGVARIQGEHCGCLYPLADTYYGFDLHQKQGYFAKRSDAEKRLSDPTFWQAQTASLEWPKLQEACRRVVHAVGNPWGTGHRWGFKEVVYGHDTKLTDMLFDLFPKAQIVYTIRNPVDQIDSLMKLGWIEADRIEEHAAVWNMKVETFKKNVARHKRSMIVRMEDLNDPETISELTSKLGLPWTKQMEAAQRSRVGEKDDSRPGLSEEEKARVERACVSDFYAPVAQLD